MKDTPNPHIGQKPNPVEKKAIKDAKRKQILPFRPSSYIPNSVRDSWRKWKQVFGTNDEVFNLLEFVRNSTAVQKIVDINEKIDFRDEDVECMWFKVKDEPLQKDLEMLIAYKKFQYTPPIITTQNTNIMTEKDHTDLYVDLIDPHEDQMKVNSPLECFLQNSPAFCKPSEEDETISICNLDYLKKYQVTKETKYGYGGKAFVKNGEIIQVSESKRGDANFNRDLTLFLNSFAVHLVVIRHAVMAHLAIYQKYMMKLTVGVPRAYQDKWHADKSAGLLMKALTPRATNTVNYNIQLLIGPANSLVSRATSFTNDGLTLLNIDKYNEYEQLDPDEMIKDIATNGSKGWNAACYRAWKAAQKAVNAICKDLDVDKEYKEESLKDLAMLLWTGTFYHGFIGDFQLDNVVKGNLPFIITGEEHKQYEWYGTLSTTIGCSTMTRTMDMATVGKYLYTKEDRDIWKEYMKELGVAAKETGIKGFTYEGAIYNAIDF